MVAPRKLLTYNARHITISPPDGLPAGAPTALFPRLQAIAVNSRDNTGRHHQGRTIMRQKTPIVIVALALMTAMAANLAVANPRDIPPGSHKVYQFNLIGHPGEYTGGCGNGNRLFVDRGTNHATVLITNGSSWDVTNCNATANNRGEITTN